MSKASGLKSEWLVENKENLALQRDATFRVSFPTTVGTIKKAPQTDHYRHHFCLPSIGNPVSQEKYQFHANQNDWLHNNQRRKRISGKNVGNILI